MIQLSVVVNGVVPSVSSSKLGSPIDASSHSVLGVDGGSLC